MLLGIGLFCLLLLKVNNTLQYLVNILAPNNNLHPRPHRLLLTTKSSAGYGGVRGQSPLIWAEGPPKKGCLRPATLGPRPQHTGLAPLV